MSIEIIIPAYNAEHTLEDALRSVASQTVPVELVTVVDDCSTDGTEAIARAFPGIRYVRNERNMGCGGNWNRCLALATQQHVALLHADDMLTPEWHARARASLELSAHADDACVYLAGTRFSDDTGKILEIFSFSDEARVYAPGRLLRALWQRCFFGLTASACTVYSRPVIERYGGFPVEEYPRMADVPYHWRLLLEEEMAYDPRVSVLIRSGAPGQVALSSGREHMLGALKSVREVVFDIATVLGCTEARVMAEYLFPYRVMQWCRKTDDAGVPELVQEAIDEAFRGVGRVGVVRIAVKHLAERVRRRSGLLKNRRGLETTVSQAVGSVRD